jgi:phosphoenolpyruvate synthase/pyruvate phosphate dikinase
VARKDIVVSGAVTPDSIVVEMGSGRVLSRETADKVVMTVSTYRRFVFSVNPLVT